MTKKLHEKKDKKTALIMIIQNIYVGRSFLSRLPLLAIPVLSPIIGQNNSGSIPIIGQKQKMPIFYQNKLFSEQTVLHQSTPR